MQRKVFRSTHAIKAWYSLVALSMLLMLAACGGTTADSSATASGGNPTPAPTPSPTPDNPTVTITTNSDGTFAFSPTTLTIKAGTTVIWMNTTAAPHTVTSDDGKSFDSGTANPITPQSGTYHFTFTTKGTFAYHCTFHPYMKATIIVTS